MDPRPEYIGFVTRAIAFVVDAAIVNAAAIIFAGAVALGLSVLPGSHDLHGFGIVIAGTAFVIWCVVYWSVFWSTTGQTPGDRAMHIRVQRLDGSSLNIVMAAIRVGATFLAALPLLAGFIPILFTARRRGFQDWIAGTVVVGSDMPELAPAAHARPLVARSRHGESRADALGSPLYNGAHNADEGTILGTDGVGGDQDGHRPVDVDGELGLGPLPGDQSTPVELGDALGEPRP
jgi:uncharacterized RDD family membrane protein YckC